MTTDERNARGPLDRSIACWAAVLTILVITCVAFSPVFSSQFSGWDDEATIRFNPNFNPPTWQSLFRRWTTPHQNIYIPVTQTVWHVLAVLSPVPAQPEDGYVTPTLFKLASISTHAITSVLALLILRRLIGPRWPSLVGAAIFALHPLQVESVAWTSGLKDLLFACFSAACLWVYIGTDTDRVRPRPARQIVALVLLLLAGLSKPTAMVVPAMLLIVDLVALRRPTKESIARLVPFVVIGLAIGLSARWIQPPLKYADQVSPALRPLVAVDSLGFYLAKLVWPTDLAIDYGRTPRRIIDEGLAGVPWRWMIDGVVLFAIVGAAWMLRRRVPLAAAGLLLALLPLGPVLGLVHFDFSYYSVVADHYAYLPMLGVALTFAALLASERVAASACLLALSSAVLIGCGVLSYRQAQTWHDMRSVSEQSLRVNPRSFASMSNLATLDLRAGQLDSGEAWLAKARQIAPGDGPLLSMMAGLAQKRGHLDAAIDYMRQALKIAPNEVRFKFRLAELLLMSDRLDEGIPAMEEVVRMDPDHPYAADYVRKAKAYATQKRAASRPTTQPTTQPAPPK